MHNGPFRGSGGIMATGFLYVLDLVVKTVSRPLVIEAFYTMKSGCRSCTLSCFDLLLITRPNRSPTDSSQNYKGSS